MATPVENQRPANARELAVELTDGTKISDERAVRWFDPEVKRWMYQVEVEGKQYLGLRTKDGKIKLL